MATKITISRTTRTEVFGDEQVVAKLRASGFQADHLHDALSEAGETYRDSVSKQFALNGAYGGHRAWNRVKPETVAQRVMGIAGPQARLVDTGGLRESWTELGKYNITEIGRRTAEFGSRYRALNKSGKKSVPVAVYHQMGTRNMPARRVLTITRALRADIVNTFVDHIMRPW